MTIQCKQVIEACDFKLADAKIIEEFLTKVTPNQLISFVWQRDKKGEHDAEWFRPFIATGYLKWKDSIACSFSEDFWYAYNVFDVMCEISVFDFPILDEMGKARDRMKKAISQSKVQNVKYIYKIFQDIPETVKAVNNVDKVQQIFKSGVIQTKEI